MKKNLNIVLTIVGLALGFSSCRVQNYLDKDERILRKYDIEIVMQDSSQVPREIHSAARNSANYVVQKPNKRFLGARWKMRIYCMVAPDDSSWWGNLWHKRGEPPMIFDKNAAWRTSEQLSTLMRTKGCFGSTVTFDTVHRGKQQVDVKYTIAATPRYKIADVWFQSPQQDINEALEQWRPNSSIKTNDYYDQDVLVAERNRIGNFLQERGYYYANHTLVHYDIDTTFDRQMLSIAVNVRQPTVTDDNGNTNPTDLYKYKIDNIYIYPNSVSAFDMKAVHFDTLISTYNSRVGPTDYYFIHNKKITPSPEVISRMMFIFNGQTYSPRIANNTTNSLMDLNNFRMIDINFEESPRSSDTNHLLDARIRLLNRAQHRLSSSFEITNGSSSYESTGNFLTSGNLGLGGNIGYRNNNLFGGAEQLSVDANLSIEIPKSVFSSHKKGFYDTFNSFETGGDITLELPEFLLPFTRNIAWHRSRPHTQFSFNTDYIFRTINIDSISLRLERIHFTGSFGYTWNHSRNVRHKLLPINITYSHNFQGEEYFIYLLLLTNDIRYLAQVESYMLLNTYYEYTYSNQMAGQRVDFDYLHLSAETCGNLVYAAEKWFGFNLNEKLGIDFYQYFRIDGEYKHYFHIGDKSVLVFRALAGICIPYLHSESIPYERVFYGGGPTTMRAWMIRRLGPGTTQTHDIKYPISVGDIQLITNIEHRFPIIGPVEGALFTDIGNIWDNSVWGIDHENRPQFKEILEGVAIGAGLGVRVNVSILTIRLDFAIPIYDPGYEAGNRWVTKNFKWNNIVTNLGINYPF